MNENECMEKLESNIGSFMGHVSIPRIINFRLMEHVKADSKAEFSLFINALKRDNKYYTENVNRY